MSIFGASLIPSSAVQGLMPGETPPVQSQAPAYKRPSTAQTIIGGIGDALQQWGGGQPTFAPEMARQRQYAQAMQLAQQQRAQQFAQQKALIDYKAQHSPGQQPEIVRLASVANDPSQPAWARAAAQGRIDALNNPVVSVPGGGLALRSYITGNMLGGQSPPTAPVGKLTPVGSPLSDEQGGATLSNAAQTGAITQAQATQVRDSFGPNGQAAFNNWLQQNNIRITG